MASEATELAAIPPSITIKAGHVQPLWAGHPWAFRQAVAELAPGIEGGAEVLLVDPNGKVLGRGLYSASSAIAVRLYTQQGSRPIDAALLRERIEAAVALRRACGLPDPTPGCETTGYRLVHGEGDGLPGLIVDAFADVLVVQLGTIGLKQRETEVVAALLEVLDPAAILDRTPKALARAEGFDVSDAEPRVLHGALPDRLAFHELGVRHELPLALGQKTGYYFDQRPLRALMIRLSRGSTVLDACCYTGAIALAAARGGAADAWGVDRSAPAVVVAAHNAAINSLGAAHFDELDAAAAFRRVADRGGVDIVVCDPPKLATGRKVRDKALGGYRKLAAGACAAVKAGGLVVLCSCSAAVDLDALQRCLALGAREIGRRAVVVERLFQGPDHPVPAAFPEGLYLKGLVARVGAP
jgi:23S rRNA (cytosine1962-C5)-methyltransferase